jgi:hypothetical protein
MFEVPILIRMSLLVDFDFELVELVEHVELVELVELVENVMSVHDLLSLGL